MSLELGTEDKRLVGGRNIPEGSRPLGVAVISFW